MSDLDKLIAAVEAGEWPWPHIGSGGGNDQHGKINGVDARIFRHGRDAYHGSLDAALRLHEALLPEWEFWLKQSHDEFSCAVAWDGIWHAMIRAEADTPARAWLLAILRALQAKEARDA
jgi:hypothetical protein